VTPFPVIGGIAVVICGYLALDWWLAGRKSQRALVRSRDAQPGNAAVDEHVIERQAQSHRDWTQGI
jgi:hypothetical protein